jgi:hypothetical protein
MIARRHDASVRRGLILHNEEFHNLYSPQITD